MAFISGGNTGETPESIKRKRAIADALLGGMAGGRQAPRNIGEGLASFGGDIGKALIAKRLMRNADSAEKSGREGAGASFSQIMAGLFPGQAPAAAPMAQPAAVAPGQPPAQPGGSTFARMIQAESGGDPNAVSPKGATGIAQIMPATARDPGFGLPDIFTLAKAKGYELPDTSDQTLQMLLRDPEINATFGQAYFEKMKALNGGDDRLGAAAYNAGPGAVQKAGGVPNFAETQAYVDKVAPQGGIAQPVAQPASGGQPMPAAQGEPPVAQRMAQFMSSQEFQFLEPAQQQIVMELFKTELQKANPAPMDALKLKREGLEIEALQNPKMTPAQQAQLDLEKEKFEFEKAKKEPDWSKLTDGSLFNERTGEVKPVPGYKPSVDFKDVNSIRKEVQDTPQIKNYMQAAPIYRSMVETAGRNSRASDLNIVYGLGKIMDPTSVVREGEMVMVKNTASLPDWLQGAIASLNGGAALTPETRAAIMNEAKSRMTAYRAETEGLRKHYEGLSQRHDINMDDIWQGLDQLPDYQPQGGGPQPGMVEDGYRFKGGNPADPNSWERVQ